MGAVTAAMVGVSGAASIASNLMSGFSAFGASKKEADRLLFEALVQSTLNQLSSLEQQEELERTSQKFEKRQSLAFTSSGVTLQGTPMLVLEETRRLAQKDLLALKRGERIERTSMISRALAQGGVLEKAGRNQLIGSFLQSFATLAKTGASAFSVAGVGGASGAGQGGSPASGGRGA